MLYSLGDERLLCVCLSALSKILSAVSRILSFFVVLHVHICDMAHPVLFRIEDAHVGNGTFFRKFD